MSNQTEQPVDEFAKDAEVIAAATKGPWMVQNPDDDSFTEVCT